MKKIKQCGKCPQGITLLARSLCYPIRMFI